MISAMANDGLWSVNRMASFKKGTSCAHVENEVLELPKKRRLLKFHKQEITSTKAQFETAKKFAEKCLSNIPYHIQKQLVKEFVERFESKTARDRLRSANIYLRKETKPLQKIIRTMPFNDMAALRRDEVLKEEARFCWAFCRHVIVDIADINETYNERLRMAYQQCLDFAKRFGIPALFDIDLNDCVEDELLESAIVRYDNEKWWLRKLARIRNQALEHLEITVGNVRKHRQEYTSNHCVSDYKNQMRSNVDYLKSMDVVNEETEERHSLFDIAQKTTSNPENRRTELMVRCRGLEDLADDAGYDAFFLTVTAPSKYHRSSKKWNGSTPKQTQQYFMCQWAKARAEIQRSKIDWFGVRVVEPHADSTPHWHLLVFCKPKQAQEMKGIVEWYALEEDGEEEGAEDHRFTCEDIDPNRSATGYIAKYISKNINAKHEEFEPDFDGTGSLKDAVIRVAAWASRWRIRQFQFFGAAKVTIWRECRRMKNPIDDESMEKVRKAADCKKWDEFTKLLQENHVSIDYEEAENSYGETVKKICGLASATFKVITREFKYRLEPKKRESDDRSLPWSTVNNCTRVSDIDSFASFSTRDSMKKIQI